MKIRITELRTKIMSTLMTGFSEEVATKIADYLVWAEMCGNRTQGIIKMTGSEPLQNILPVKNISIVKDTKLSQLIDAGAYPAPYASQLATDVVIKKASEHGFAIVGVNNTFSSNGAQAYYAERIAKHDLIGIVMARSPASFAPFDSVDPLFGTNPIAFSYPTYDNPLTFDMASSAMTWYGLVLAKARGEAIPKNMAIDKDGKPTVDPAAAMEGALLPFDRSYKGSGIGMMVELLAGPLVGAAYCSYDEADDWGSLFIAIDPNLLVDIVAFKANCSDLIAKVKNSRTKADSQQIRLPGERSRDAYNEAERSGFVIVEDSVLRQLGYIS